jgi:ferritin-like metal-binding protein YciE
MAQETNPLEELLIDQLKDLYSAENQIIKALPKMTKAATAPELKRAFERHLEETRRQVERLNQIADNLEVKLTGKKCKGMEGLIEEGKEIMEEDLDENAIDAGLIGAAQKVEHYEIAAYGTAAAHARLLRMDDIVRMLEQTLSEEKAADAKLTEIAEMVVNMDAATADDEAAGNGASRGAASAGNGRASSRTTERGRPARPSRSSAAHEKGRASARGRR